MASTRISAPSGDLERGPTSDGKPKADSLERFVDAVERNSVWVLSGLMALSGALLLYMGRGLSFYYDEWEWVIHDYGGGIHWLLLAHVGNISVFPAAIYRVLFHLVGLNHYAVFRLDVIVLHLVCGLLVFVLAARRIPRFPALLAAALILFLGAAWNDLLWAFQVGYLLSVAGGLATWVLLEEERGWSDIAAMLCLLVAAGSSSLGIPVMVGVAVELARQRRRGWIVLIPAALYALWYLGYGVSQVTENSLINAPGFAEDLAAAAFGGLIGRGLDWGRPLALIGLLIVLRRLVRPVPVSARLAGLLAAGLALWAVTAVARSTISPPEASRYIYLGAVVIVLMGVELLRGVTITPRASAIAMLVVGFCAVTGLTLMRAGAVGLRATSKTVTAELGALELAAAYAPPGYQMDPVNAPPIFAGPYLHVVRSIGSSPADTPAEILASEPSVRAAADEVLLALETPKLVPVIGTGASMSASAPSLLASTTSTQARHGGCIDLTPTSDSAMTILVRLPRDGVLVEDKGGTAVTILLRRFGEEFTAIPSAVPPKTNIALSIPTDSSKIAWELQMRSSSPLSICGVGA